MIESVADDAYLLQLPYPTKGTTAEKESVVREALVRMPLLASVRQFRRLGDSIDVSLRKGATVQGVDHFDPKAFAPLIKWAESLGALDPKIQIESLLDDAESRKEQRHKSDSDKRVVFLSHSSKDKPFVRRLAADLATEGIDVWLDEQRIRVGDSIPESIAQGLASSDYFVIVLSEHSIESEWVKKEMSDALVNEIEKRRVHVLPALLSDCQLPPSIKSKKFADFREAYKVGFEELVLAIRSDTENVDGK